MQPVEFPEKTHNLGAPKGVSDDECGGLPAIAVVTPTGEFAGIVSCWEMTEDEWLDIRNNGMKLWLKVCTPRHPMVALSVEKPFSIAPTDGEETTS